MQREGVVVCVGWVAERKGKMYVKNKERRQNTKLDPKINRCVYLLFHSFNPFVFCSLCDFSLLACMYKSLYVYVSFVTNRARRSSLLFFFLYLMLFFMLYLFPLFTSTLYCAGGGERQSRGGKPRQGNHSARARYAPYACPPTPLAGTWWRGTPS